MVYEYFIVYDLFYYLFFDQGYVFVGDWYFSWFLMVYDEDERDICFYGFKQECGLYLFLFLEVGQSLDFSVLQGS